MGRLSRRTFIKGAFGAAAAASAGAAGGLFWRCAGRKEFDLVISGGTLYDGSGGTPVRADIGVKEGSIEYVGRIAPSRGRLVFEAAGRAVSPGFIDVHDHTAEGLLINRRAESAVRQGVTTLVSGNCGDSPFPMNDEMFARTREAMKDEHGLDLTWKEARGFLERLERAGIAVNYATFVGHGSVRAAAMGFGNRRATEEELDAMRALVLSSMEDGCLGLSSGLEYSPGSFAPTEELVELCRVAARKNGIYATHMRDEEAEVLEALDEAIRIARQAAIRLQISHLKIGYAPNWDKFDDLVARIDRAHAEGIDLRADRYPYIAWATGLSLFFPLWSREGQVEAFVARLRDPSLQGRLKAEVMEKEKELGSWDKVFISHVATESNRGLEGRSVLEAAAGAGKGAFEFMRDLLIEEGGRVGMITFGMSESHLKRLLAHPLVGVGADGSALAPYGALAKGKPHPRSYGTFARVLGKYVRDEKVVPLEEMIRKMTSMPAAHLGFVCRGLIKAGWAADLVVFDPERVNDRATFAEPMAYPEGIDGVVVNGRIVVERGEHTGALPGRVLRKDMKGAVS